MVGLVVLLAAIAAFAGRASAHAVLVSSVPAEDETVDSAPYAVVLHFDDAVSAEGGGSVKVLDPGGRRLDEGDVRSSGGGRTLTQGVAAGGEGTYTVSYRVLSGDGHVISGSYVFHVGRATAGAAVGERGDPVVSIVGAVGRTLAFAGSLLAVGALGVALLVDAGRVDRRKGRSWTTRWPDRRVWLIAGALALPGCLLAAAALSAELAGGSILGALGAPGDAVAAFGWSTGPVARLVAAGLFLVLVALPRRWAWPPATAAVVALVLLLLPAFSGHASTVSVGATATDALHLLGAAAWAGGLAVLGLTWVPDADRLRRFSRLAAVGAVVVVSTGALSSWWQSDVSARGFAAALDTALDSMWGRSLAVKLGLVAVVLAIGWLHRRRLAAPARQVDALVGSKRGVVVGGGGGGAPTAVLVSSVPPRDEPANPFQAVRHAGEVTMRIQVDPARAGSNDLHLWFLALDGSPLGVDAAEVRVSSPEVEPRRVPVELLTPSHGTGRVGLAAGTWTVEVAVVAKGIRSTTEFEVPVT